MAHYYAPSHLSTSSSRWALLLSAGFLSAGAAAYYILSQRSVQLEAEHKRQREAADALRPLRDALTCAAAARATLGDDDVDGGDRSGDGNDDDDDDVPVRVCCVRWLCAAIDTMPRAWCATKTKTHSS